MEDVLSSSAEAWQRSFTQLKVLDCSDCELSSWTNQIQAYFGKLPALEQLSLDDNPISSIPTAQGDNSSTTSAYFSSLRSLQLAGTAISTWKDLEGVNDIKNLQSLRLKNTPLTCYQLMMRFL
jgi:Leucine-rich repeat (LRR) protein